MPHQYVGTMVDNTIALLCAPLNALTGGALRSEFEQLGNWISLMQAVHRSFFASIMMAVEKGCGDVCAEANVAVVARPTDRIRKLIDQIEKAAPDNDVVARAVPKLRDAVARQPAFTDYLETAMSVKNLNERERRTWRGFFRALSIVRNKLSHSDTTLSDNERTAMREGGCGALIGEEGQLVLNPRMFCQVAMFALQFFDLLTAPPKAPPTR